MNKIIKRIIPQKIFEIIQDLSFSKYRNLSVEETFSKAYRENIWGGKEGVFCSGSGTSNKNTESYIQACTSFIKDKSIHSVLDIGCGDFTIMSKVVQATGVNFTGIDVARDLIEHNKKHNSHKNVQFLHVNAITDEFPKADLITIRQVLQHLSNDQILQILPKAINAARYLMITEHLPSGVHVNYNLDKQTGPDIRLLKNSGVFLEQPPFSLKVQEVILEYPEDFEKYGGKIIPAVMRTSLFKGNL